MEGPEVRRSGLRVSTFDLRMGIGGLVFRVWSLGFGIWVWVRGLGFSFARAGRRSLEAFDT
jgi:hypothetical protein